MDKKLLLTSLREKRKKYGKESKEVYKVIHNLVKYFPYYEGYYEKWVNSHGHKI